MTVCKPAVASQPLCCCWRARGCCARHQHLCAAGRRRMVQRREFGGLPCCRRRWRAGKPDQDRARPQPAFRQPRSDGACQADQSMCAWAVAFICGLLRRWARAPYLHDFWGIGYLASVLHQAKMNIWGCLPSAAFLYIFHLHSCLSSCRRCIFWARKKHTTTMTYPDEVLFSSSCAAAAVFAGRIGFKRAYVLVLRYRFAALRHHVCRACRSAMPHITTG